MAVVTAAAPFVGYRGKLQNLFFYTDARGVVHMRPAPEGRDGNTPAQQQARRDLPSASRFWAELTDDERARWLEYGESVGRQGYRAFSGLAAKYRRLHPGATPPSGPPTEPFFGDSVGVSAEVPPDARGVVRFEARRPGQEGVVVELLTQRMAARHRTPKPRDWRSHGFVHFAEGDLSADLALPAGAYALAYRYVSLADGRETAMAEVGRVTVTSGG